MNEFADDVRAEAARYAEPDEVERVVSDTFARLSWRARRAAQAMKRCPSCQETKPASEFGRNAARPDGLQSMCKRCR